MFTEHTHTHTLCCLVDHYCWTLGTCPDNTVPSHWNAATHTHTWWAWQNVLCLFGAVQLLWGCSSLGSDHCLMWLYLSLWGRCCCPFSGFLPSFHALSCYVFHLCIFAAVIYLILTLWKINNYIIYFSFLKMYFSFWFWVNWALLPPNWDLSPPAGHQL